LRGSNRQDKIVFMEYAVITAVGPDTIGIMDRLAETVASLGANIEETRASILGGEFAVIMLVTGSQGIAGLLGAKLQATGTSMSLSITVKQTKSPATPKGLPYIIESISLDTPGIVRAVSGVLKSSGINIEDLETSVLAAPLSGSPMFTMRIGINITPGSRLNALKEDLSRIAAEHDLDIEIRALKATGGASLNQC
jgi:glycine cleavage system transcriptional repressor